MIEIKTPEFPESIADGEVATWHVDVGEAVRRDQILVDIETDKVVIEVVAPAAGKLTRILKEIGETVLSEEVLAEFEAGEAVEAAPAVTQADVAVAVESESDEEVLTSPAARKIAEENKIDVTRIEGSGKGGRVTKEDVLKAVAGLEQQEVATSASSNSQTRVAMPIPAADNDERVERRVPMTRLRASIARRLVEAQQTAAMLTTFNEVDMQAIMDLRAQYRDAFEKAHNGTRLGFMSFFVRASIEALKRFPAVNASIDGNDIVYHGYQDIGVAVSSPRGLVVPVIREADSLTLAELEDQVRDYGIKARDGKLSIDEMTGGTFTISNGGVFGSLLSTPILNPPQTGILGMHKIQERPMAVNGEMVIRPMMYLALSYDHRIIDGSEAVRFLVTIKDFLEEPARILLDI
jgi:2-oxoglutarate dehydrogenase E2 component (dihydrolipoamide succinyltransferase)